MGTVWTYVCRQVPTGLPLEPLKERLGQIAYQYDVTFSDWSDDSELRQIEKAGLTHESHPSTLFMKGLQYAQEAYERTGGAFDITVGAVLWKVKSRAVGMNHLKISGEKFYFDQDPVRLTFGGIVKGMATGEMLFLLQQSGLRECTLNAGGGNGVISDEQGVRFYSRSRIFQKTTKGEVQHIFSTGSAPLTTLRESAELECQSPSIKFSELQRWGALSDAFSKAVILRDDWIPPENCKIGRAAPVKP